MKCYLPKYKGCLEEKLLWDSLSCECLVRQAELASFFKKHHIYLKEQLMDKRLFELEYLADMFLKMNKYSCYLKENNWQNLLPTIKSKLKKLEFWKTYWSLELEGFPLLKNYSDEINSDINKCDSPYIIHMEGLNDFEPIFQVANALYYQINCGTHLEPHSWYKYYFRLKTFEIQEMQKKAFWELPLSD